MESVSEVAPGFAGFEADAFAFLRELAASQERAWFEANRDRYEAGLRAPMMALVADLASELHRRRIGLQGDPRNAMFRIHRDVRFSKDKRPYKTHLGATLTRDGAKMSQGLLYIHIDPEGSFAAAGFYRPEPDQLAAIRARIADKPAVFRAMLRKLAAAGLALGHDEDALKRPPRGFEHVADPDLAGALRRCSFIVRRPLAKADTAGPGLTTLLAGFAEAASPLLEFGWRALGTVRG